MDSEVQAMQLTAVLGDMIRFLLESILQPTRDVELMCDNRSAITYAKGEGTWKTKNLINKVQSIREMVSKMELESTLCLIRCKERVSGRTDIA